MQPDIDTRPDPEVDLSPDAPRRMDQAVRAALSRRPPEPRSFGNEDDVEGPRTSGPKP